MDGANAHNVTASGASPRTHGFVLVSAGQGVRYYHQSRIVAPFPNVYTPSGMVLEAFGLTNIGPARQTNEDCFASVEELCLFAVADGMGGSAAGEVVATSNIEALSDGIAVRQ